MKQLTLLLALLPLACGPAEGTPPVAPTTTAVAPTPQPSITSSPQACSPGPASPLIIQMDGEARANLEMALKEGIGVVAYDCKSLRVIPSCRAEGRYEIAFTPRKDVNLHVGSREEADAASSLHGPSVPPFQLAQGETLELQLVTAAALRTNVARLAAKDLQGECDGATHFVHGAALGAFTMSQKTSPGGHQKSSMSAAGNLQTCPPAGATPARPPPQCSGVVRVDLVPITR
jgi:uncharacterized protein